MKIGIPRAFFYYKYHSLMLAFFDKLGIEVVISPRTNKKILATGASLSIDESCLAAKIFIGHVKWLIGKCDYIFIPRIENFGKCDIACVKFFGIYDIVKNTFNAEIIDFNINEAHGLTEKKAYIDLGRQLGFSKRVSTTAYSCAKVVQSDYDKKLELAINAQLKSDKAKIVVVAHAYNTHDEFIGKPVINTLKKCGAEVILASDLCGEHYKELYKQFSDSLYWVYNKELVGAVAWLLDKIDGIVLVTAFPCGPDSLVNELLKLKQKTVPMIELCIDELQGQAGIETRIESFIDILTFKKRGALK